MTTTPTTTTITTTYNTEDLEDLAKIINEARTFVNVMQRTHPVDAFAMTVYDRHGVYIIGEVFWDSESETLKTDLARYGSA